MPAEITTRRRPGTGNGVAIGASAPLELAFAIFRLLNPGHHGESLEWLDTLEAVDPGWQTRLREFWPDGSDCASELVVLAWRAGALDDSSIEPLLRWIRSTAADFTPPATMPSESPELEREIGARLQLLAADPAKREAYAALLESFWQAALATAWRAGGQERAERLVTGFNPVAERPEEWRSHIQGALFRRQPHAALIDAAARNQNLFVAPLALCPAGQMIYAFDGFVIIAAGEHAGEKTQARKRMAERTAATFKVFSDPTRLALLSSLMGVPSSVTDLAGMFELAQPTVSVHVKILREAGLLESERQGNQTVYRALPETVERVLNDAQDALMTIRDC